jgi:UPF0755 protein
MTDDTRPGPDGSSIDPMLGGQGADSIDPMSGGQGADEYSGGEGEPEPAWAGPADLDPEVDWGDSDHAEPWEVDEAGGAEQWDPAAPMPEGPPAEPGAPDHFEIPAYDPMGDPRIAHEDQILRRNEDWVRLPRPWGPLRRLGLVLAAIVVLLGGTAWFVNDWFQRQLDPPGGPGEIVTIEIPDGASTNDIARILSNEGVVPNATVARYYFRYKNAGPFLAGEYAVARNSAVWEVREVLEAGPIPRTFETITIPEGLWLTQIMPRLLDQLPAFDPVELDRALEGGLVRSRFQPAGITTLEGLLFPDTYAIDDESDANEIDLVRRMVQQMDTVLTDVGYDSAEAVTGYTPYELIIIASLIEEEAFVPEDRAKISRVIHNRLEAGMPLQIDATVLYAIGEQKEELTVTDLAIESPYNTRINTGLPPTPIAAPGRAALEAALAPEPGPWLFYVLADEDGSHFFTDDFDEFNRQVAESRAAGIF